MKMVPDQSAAGFGHHCQSAAAITVVSRSIDLEGVHGTTNASDFECARLLDHSDFR